MNALILLAAITSQVITFGDQVSETVDGQTVDMTVSSGDGVILGDKRFILICQTDWDWCTNTIRKWQIKCEQLHSYYKKMNENETGRAALHGRRGHTTITNGFEVIKYADGYEHVTKITKADRQHAGPQPRPFKKPEAPAKSVFAKRREAMRKARIESQSKTNEVSVTIHGGAK